MNRIIVVLFVVLALAALAAPVLAQAPQLAPADSSYLEQFRGKSFGEIVPKVWLEVCAMNRAQYPDSNLVFPGDVIALPLGKQYVAKPGGTDHMWQASTYFSNEAVMSYLLGDTAVPVVTQPVQVVEEESKSGSSNFGLWVLIVAALVVASLYLFRFWRSKRKPFVKHPPDFRAATDAQVRPVAEAALGRAFGQGTQIIGRIERGTISGRQVIFFGGGPHTTETYRNEPGYRARVRFQDGTETSVVSRWSCFNPVWSAVWAEFEGTFTPEGGQPEAIERISDAQAAHLGVAMQEIASGREPTVSVSTIIPGRQPAPVAGPTPAPPAAAVAEEREEKLHLTKVQISSEKGLNLEGDIPLSVEELKELIAQVKGEAPKEE